MKQKRTTLIGVAVLCAAIALPVCFAMFGTTGGQDDRAKPIAIAVQGANTANKAAAPVKDEPLSFNRDIRPILSDKCYWCHGPDAETREAGLRIDLEEPAKADLGGYATIVPGSRADSELWLRITDKADPMPPKKAHKTLSEEEIETIGKWIDQGAPYELHWAYEPVQRLDLPAKALETPERVIDELIGDRLASHGVAASPQTDKRTLVRRVTLDLTGLPPTPQQVNAFLADDSPNAYQDYIDALLASPAYGEHMAVWWLDLVRYADTIGFHSDNPRQVWPYRDWVIRSLTENMPFDQFTVMQLAGDLLQEEPTQDMLIASAYNRLNPTTEEGGAQAKEYQAIYNADRVTNYGEVWLGSSIGCAQCHDHKFDPITMEDFYTLAAFFGSLSSAAVGRNHEHAKYEPPYMFLPENDEQREMIADVEARYRSFIDGYPNATLLEEYFSARKQTRPELPGGEEPEYATDFEKILKERAAFADQVPTIPIARDLRTPRTVRILNRGNWQDETGRVVQPATPAFLGGPASTETQRLNRLDLAKWTVSKDNPLTARAITNRLWARYMGSPLSSNTLDLGSQGTVPTHPRLLDFLATQFIDSGWDLRHMVRTIVLSETYKQSSNTRADLAILDPDNTRLFARQSARRLPAEAVRDQALAVSGLLTEKIGGPSVFPYQPEGHWEPLNFPKRTWHQSEGDDLYRRGMYTWAQRTFPHPQMVAFDAPTRESCTGQRLVSSTPLQSLALLNGPSFVEAARVFAQELVQTDGTNQDRLEMLYQRTLSRSPRANELATLTGLLAKHRERFSADPEAAAALLAVGDSPAIDALDPAEVAAWTSVCRVVLNLHETITRH